ncbi:MAG TPA: NmrA family NAD(P)-binding protein [Candidatus Didemnitutus sp.]|jgi:uncharacterized protein YbjT (DUF2867 family)
MKNSGSKITRDIVLVTGAAGGQQGRTGRHVAEMLLARGVPVRAFVHRSDARSERLRARGAEVVEGDFLDYPSVRRAVRGVSSVYFAYPVQEGLLDATAIMVAAAREAGVFRLVDLVMYLSSPDAPTPRMRQNYFSEQVFEWAGIGAAHVRATVFYENIRALVSPTLTTQGMVLLPWGSDRTAISLVSAEDVARVVTGVLTGPPVPTGSVFPVIGEVLTLRDIVDTLGRVFDRTVRYEDITDEQWRDGALAQGLNRHAVEHLSQLWRSIRANPVASVVPDTIKRLGGVEPKTFEEFARQEKDSFTPQRKS